MSRVAGNQGAVVVGGITLKTQKWSFDGQTEYAKAPAMGDLGTYRCFLRTDFKAEVEAVVDLGAFPAIYALLGNFVAFALKVVSGNTGLVVGSGDLTDVTTDVPVDDKVTIKLTIENSDGSRPTITPSSP